MQGRYLSMMTDLCALFSERDNVYETIHITHAPKGGVKIQFRINGKLAHTHVLTRTEAIGFKAMLNETIEYSNEMMYDGEDQNDDE